MKFKRLIIGIVAFSFLYLIGAILGGAIFKYQGEKWILNQLNKSKDWDVSLLSVDTNFLNSVSIQQIKAKGPFIVDIEDLKISFKPWGFILKPSLSSLLEIQINQPSIQGSFPMSPKGKKKPEFPRSLRKMNLPFSAALKNGHLQLTSDKENISVQNIALQIDSGLFETKIQGVGESPLIGAIDSELRIENQKEKKWDLQANISKFNLASIERVNKKVKGLKNIKGSVDLDIKSHGVWSHEKGLYDFDWRVRLKDNAVTWTPKKGFEKRRLRAHLDISPKEVSGNVNVEDKYKFSGKITQPFSKPYVEVESAIQKETLQEFLTLIGIRSQATIVNGDLSGEIQVTGPLKNPNVNGSFALNADRGHLKLPQIKGDIQIIDKEFLLGADISGGKLQIWSPLKEKGQREINLSVEKMNIQNVAQLNGWENVRGRFGANLNVKELSLSPLVEGTFNLEELNWGRQSLHKFIAGKVRIRNDHLEVKTNEDVLNVDAKFQENGVDLEKFQIRFGGESEIAINGAFEFDKELVQLTVRGHEIPPDMWPPLVSRYPEISGHLDFEGIVGVRQKVPHAKLDVLFSKLKFVPQGGVWNGTARLLWDEERFSLRKIDVDGGYRGEITRKKGGSKGQWQINLTMNDSDPQLLLDVFKSTNLVTGTINGETEVKVEGEKFIGTSSMTWRAGSVGPFQFDHLTFKADMDPHQISFKDLFVLKGLRSFRGQLHLSPSGKKWSYRMELQSQQWGGNRISVDGGIFSEGEFSPGSGLLQGNLRSPLLWVNEYPFDNLNVEFKRSKDEWQMNGKTDNNVSMDFLYNTQLKTLRGQFTAASINIEKLTTRFLPPFGFSADASGMGQAKVKLRGTLEDPQWHINLNLKKARWREEEFDSKLFLKITKSTVSIISSKTKLKSGGRVFAKGQFLKENKYLSLDGVGSHIALNSIFGFLRWPIQWEGKTDATVSIKGEKNNRKTEIVFDGEHNGIGPFSEEGAIIGKAIGSKGEWNLEGIRVESGDGFAQLRKGSKIFVDRDKSTKMRIAADTRNLSAGVLTFFGGIELTGSWEQGSESMEEAESPKEMDIFARSLWINQFLLNGNITHLTIKKGELSFSPILGSKQRISGVLDYSDYPHMRVDEFTLVEDGDEKFFLDGWVGGPKWDYRLRTNSLDANVIRGLLDTTIPFSGPLDVNLRGKGSLREPKVSGNLTWKKGSFGVLPVDFANCKFLFSNGIIDITKLIARKKRGYFVKGRIKIGTNLTEAGLRQEPEIHLKIEKGDFAVLKDIWPPVYKAKGSFNGLFSLGGQGDNRVLTGYFNAEDVKFHSTSYIPYLKKGRLKINFDDNVLTITEGRAKLKKGYLNLGGDVSFRGKEPEEYNLSLYTSSKRGVAIRIPDLAIPPGPVLGKFSILKTKLAGISRGEPFINLKLIGPSKSPTLSGKLELENTIFTYPPTKETGRKKGQPTVARTWLRNFLDKLNWDVVLSAGKRTRYENKLVDAKVDGSLHISGPTKDISVNGRIHASQGSIVYSGNEFKIVDANLEIFTQTPVIDKIEEKQTFVYLKAEAEKDVYYTDGLGEGNQDTIVMEVDRALLGEIRPRFRSKNNPSISSKKALQLALGLPVSQSFNESDLFSEANQTSSSQGDFDRVLRTGLVQLLDSSLASPLARAVARQTGLVDFIRVTYQGDNNSVEQSYGNDDTSLNSSNDVKESELLRVMKGTKVKMGRELSSRLFADYSFRVDEFQNELDLRARIGIGLSPPPKFVPQSDQ